MSVFTRPSSQHRAPHIFENQRPCDRDKHLPLPLPEFPGSPARERSWGAGLSLRRGGGAAGPPRASPRICRLPRRRARPAAGRRVMSLTLSRRRVVSLTHSLVREVMSLGLSPQRARPGGVGTGTLASARGEAPGKAERDLRLVAVAGRAEAAGVGAPAHAHRVKPEDRVLAVGLVRRALLEDREELKHAHLRGAAHGLCRCKAGRGARTTRQNERVWTCMRRRSSHESLERTHMGLHMRRGPTCSAMSCAAIRVTTTSFTSWNRLCNPTRFSTVSFTRVPGTCPKPARPRLIRRARQARPAGGARARGVPPRPALPPTAPTVSRLGRLNASCFIPKQSHILRDSTQCPRREIQRNALAASSLKSVSCPRGRALHVWAEQRSLDRVRSHALVIDLCASPRGSAQPGAARAGRRDVAPVRVRGGMATVGGAVGGKGGALERCSAMRRRWCRPERGGRGRAGAGVPARAHGRVVRRVQLVREEGRKVSS